MENNPLNKVSLNVVRMYTRISDFDKHPTTPIEYDEAYDANGERLYDANDRALFVRKS